MKPTQQFERTTRIATLIQQELASLLLTEVKDPRIDGVNITAVRVSKDLSHAKVYYLLLTSADELSEKAQSRRKRRVAAGLESVGGYLRRELGKRIQLRTIPQLHFYWDDVIEHGRHMEQVFSEINDGEQSEESE